MQSTQRDVAYTLGTPFYFSVYIKVPNKLASLHVYYARFSLL